MTKTEFENLDNLSQTEEITNNGRIIISYFKGTNTMHIYKVHNFLVKITVSNDKRMIYEPIEQTDGFTIFESIPQKNKYCDN